MSAIVLFDGEAASLKSVEIGGVAPGLFMCDHTTEELILLHIWSVANQYSMLSALHAKKALLQEEDQQQQQHHEKLQEENKVNDISDIYRSVVNDPTEKKNTMQHVAEVVQRALTLVNEHKLLKNSLVYTIETARVEPEVTIFSHIHDCERANLSEQTEKSQNVKEDENHDSTENDEDAVDANYLHMIKKSIASTLVHHVRERAMHYETKTNRKPVIVCGAGNNIEGKQIQTGTVTHALWFEMRNEYELCFVKAEGSTWRPRASRVRYMVVVPLTVQITLEEEQKNCETCNCLTTFLHIISQTMQRRRAMSNDTVSVLLLVESNVKEQVVLEFTAAINSLISQTDKQEPNNEEMQRKELDKENNTSSNGAQTDDVQEENIIEQVTDEKTSLVEIVYLKGNKSNNNSATFANSQTQVTKMLHEHCKCEFVVIDALADKWVQMILLSLSKPHCIIIPPSNIKKKPE